MVVSKRTQGVPSALTGASPTRCRELSPPLRRVRSTPPSPLTTAVPLTTSQSCPFQVRSTMAVSVLLSAEEPTAFSAVTL